jgi:tetratricopeptide (TPR) repeat protein
MEAAMKATVNLFDHLLRQGKQFQALRRHRDALRVFEVLAGFRQLPPHIAEQTQVHLAELHLKARRFKRARRHLAAALDHQPECARYHYLMGAACHAEPEGDRGRATEHYRRALELDPEYRKCLADSGLLLLEMGQTEEGLARLRRAQELAPGDVRVLGKLVKGLLGAGRAEEARRALREALFRDRRNPRLNKLWNDFQFQELRRRQESERAVRTGEETDGPVLLPFVRPAVEAQTGGGPRKETWAG